MNTLYNRFIKYIDKATRDPKAENEERKVKKALKEAQNKASSVLAQEKALLQNAQNTQSPGRPEEAMRYSIFPEDAKVIQTLLDNATNAVNAAQNAEEVDDYMKEHFNINYENYKINSIFNTAVYPKAIGERVGLWLVLRGIKQFIHDNKDLTTEQIGLLNLVHADIKKFLEDVKYQKAGTWKAIAVQDLKNLEKYKTILQTSPDKVDKNSKTYIMLMSLAPKIYPTVLKLLKNHGEVDFPDKEGDAFTGNITEESVKAKAVKADKTNDNFDVGSLISKTFSYMFSILFLLLTLFLLSLGSSLAVNLNVHKPFPYKIFYMIYGFLFGLFVVPYVLLYRWWLHGQQPEYYGFIPLIPRHFVNPTVQFLLGWMTYRPLNTIDKLEEWKLPATSITPL